MPEQSQLNAEEAEIIIAKHRNGPTGKVILGFQPAYARYRLLTNRYVDSPDF